MKYTYYDYLDFINGKKIKVEKEITFEVFYPFYEKAVKHAVKQAKNKKLNLDKILINEKFYLKYAKEKYFYNEDFIDNVVDIAKMSVNVNKNIAQDKATEAGESAKKIITSTETGDMLYKKLASLGSTVSLYLKTIGISASETTKALVEQVFAFVNLFMNKIIKVTHIMQDKKDKIMSDIEHGVADIVAKIIGNETDKNEIIKKIREKEADFSNYFVKNPDLRLGIGCLLAAGICYIWTHSASTGNPLMDFNVDIYINLMSSTVPLFKIISLTFLIELFVFFIIKKIKSISTYLPNWFGLAGNLTIVGGLLLTAFLIKKIDESKDPDLVKFKKKICGFLNKPKDQVGEKIGGEFGDLLVKIGQKSGVINTNTNIAATCSI